MRFFFPIIAVLLLPVSAASAVAEKAVLPAAPSLQARAYVLYDFTSNQVLVESKNANDRMPPAALTKLMTAYLAFSAIKQHQFPLNQQIYPSLAASNPGNDEARMFLDRAKAVTVDELLHGLTIPAGDDAARVFAELISGNETAFAEQMNSHALALGMQNTHFVNATGQPAPGQYSSAYDMALLAAALMRDFPEYYQLYGVREFLYNNVKLYNANRLLWKDPFVDGMAAGDAEMGGLHLVAASRRDDRRLISVLLGAPSEALRDGESQKLLNYGFRNFETMTLYQRNQPVSSPRLWKGAKRTIAVGFPQGLSITVPKGTQLKIKATMETRQPIVAPVRAGSQIGVLKVTLNGAAYAEYPLVALENVPLANVFSRGWDNIRLMFE